MYGLDGPDALQGDSIGLIRGVADSVDAFDEARAAAEAAEIPWPAEEIDSAASNAQPSKLTLTQRVPGAPSSG